MALAAVGIPRIRTSVRIDTLFEPESRVIADYAWIERSIGPLVPIEVIVRFDEGHAVRASERLDLVQAIEARLRARGDVTGVVSAATFLPALPPAGSLRGATQRAIASRRLERDLARADAIRYVRDVPDGQLWRVTARVPALEDIDYGVLLDRVRAEIAPVVAAAGGAGRGIVATCTGAMPLVHSIQHTLLAALDNAVADGPPTRTGMLRSVAASMTKRDVPGDAHVPLTPRELQTLRLIAMGLSNREIADTMGISVETVKEHVQNMLRKTSLHDRTQAAVWALRNGLA